MGETPTSTVRLRILGPLRAWRGDEELHLGSPQQRQVLALLLARSGESVGLDDLVYLLWQENAPHSAANLVRRYVGQLRRLLEPELPLRAAGSLLVLKSGGYRFSADEMSLDLLCYRRMATEARRVGATSAPGEAVEPYLAALRLWHGRCAEGTRGDSTVSSVFTAVDHEYTTLLREAVDIADKAGEGMRILPLLSAAAARDRLDESLQAQLVLLLASVGRQAEALRTYRSVCDHLAQELGVDPGPELRGAYQDVLSQRRDPNVGEGSILDRGGAESAVRPPVVRPAQLPPVLPVFAGRQRELAALGSLLSAEDRPPGSPTVTIVAIDGMPGAGKTTLALRWVHQVAGQFSDGQLYVNLRGHDPASAALRATEALRGFLSALGIPDSGVPSGYEAQTGLYRSLLAGRRMLVLLDNARDMDQVGPLLPGTAGCLVVVTSRSRITGLVADHGAHLVTLGPLPCHEAKQVLTRRIGVDRCAADPRAVDDLVWLCARLPLALAGVATHALAHPHFTLATIVQDLGSADNLLDALGSGIRTAFDSSYQSLGQPAAHLFRLLGCSPTADLSRAAIARLSGRSTGELAVVLDELTRSHLITQCHPGHYVMHDLIRTYARDLGTALDSAAERRAALRWLVDHDRQSAPAEGPPPGWTGPPPQRSDGTQLDKACDRV
jgi:DNA-binding SARP family transcriptional activator